MLFSFLIDKPIAGPQYQTYTLSRFCMGTVPGVDRHCFMEMSPYSEGRYPFLLNRKTGLPGVPPG